MVTMAGGTAEKCLVFPNVLLQRAQVVVLVALLVTVAVVDGQGLNLSEIENNEMALVWSQYCGRVCEGGSLVETLADDVCPAVECYPCDCGRHCRLTGTCCPVRDPETLKVSLDLDPPVTATSDDDDDDYLHEIRDRVRCRRVPFTTDSETYYLTVARCPDTWKDQTVRRECQNPDGQSFQSLIPYTDLSTGLVFANLFCLVCHGISRPDPTNTEHVQNLTVVAKDTTIPVRAWAPYALLTFYPHPLYELNDPFQFYKQALESVVNHRTVGRITFQDPSGATQCPPLWPRETVETTDCERGGVVGAEVSTVERLCGLSQWPIALNAYGHKNIFCALCSGKHRVFKKCPEPPRQKPPPKWVRLPESIKVGSFLKIKIEGGQGSVGSNSNCSLALGGNDKTYGCLPLECPPGKLVGDNGLCESMHAGVHSVYYKTNFIYLYGGSEENAMAMGQNVENAFYQMHGHISSIGMKIYICFNGSKTFHHEFDMQGTVYSQTILRRDEFEDRYLDIATRLNTATSDRKTGTTTTHRSLRLVCTGEEMCAMYRRQRTQRLCYEHNPDTDRIVNAATSFRTHMTPSLRCPSVRLNQTRPARVVPVQEGSAVTMTLTVRPPWWGDEEEEEQLDIPWSPNVSVQNGQVLVCRDAYVDLVTRARTRRRTSSSSSSSGQPTPSSWWTVVIPVPITMTWGLVSACKRLWWR